MNQYIYKDILEENFQVENITILDYISTWQWFKILYEKRCEKLISIISEWFYWDLLKIIFQTWIYQFTQLNFS